MLSGDAAISTVVPFGCHDLLLSTCDDIESNIPVHDKFQWYFALFRSQGMVTACLIVLCDRYHFKKVRMHEVVMPATCDDKP